MRATRRYFFLALSVLALALLGYLGYVVYPRFDLPMVEGVPLLALALGAGVASFFSPCAFPLLLTLLGRESRGSRGGDEDEPARGRPLRFAAAMSLGAAAFVLVVGGVMVLGGRALVGGVVFTSSAGRVLRGVVGVFLLAMGLVQLGVLPSPLQTVEGAVRPLLRRQAETRRKAPLLGQVTFGFGYLLGGFG